MVSTEFNSSFNLSLDIETWALVFLLINILASRVIGLWAFKPIQRHYSRLLKRAVGKFEGLMEGKVTDLQLLVESKDADINRLIKAIFDGLKTFVERRVDILKALLTAQLAVLATRVAAAEALMTETNAHATATEERVAAAKERAAEQRRLLFEKIQGWGTLNHQLNTSHGARMSTLAGDDLEGAHGSFMHAVGEALKELQTQVAALQQASARQVPAVGQYPARGYHQGQQGFYR
ncbi:hypothetical protein BS50DRAFT_628394 [Corynespora cassiicola Philippines]|uniref:Uncharacterized protein n=1 Tax=Corynespora cassiicola Philippines TaxID=1448308 RepID=A0A2T2PCT0_CORCC|nr:hypothetical protein BS50DRAFT_628394 [Corynespora cassiicola Philippines]